jgi:hypothetical protein
MFSMNGYPYGWPYPTNQQFAQNTLPITQTIYVPGISRDEFDELKRDVLEMKELLKRAKDAEDCETEEKVALIRKVAKLVGVDLGAIS